MVGELWMSRHWCWSRSRTVHALAVRSSSILIMMSWKARRAWSAAGTEKRSGTVETVLA